MAMYSGTWIERKSSYRPCIPPRRCSIGTAPEDTPKAHVTTYLQQNGTTPGPSANKPQSQGRCVFALLWARGILIDVLELAQIPLDLRPTLARSPRVECRIMQNHDLAASGRRDQGRARWIAIVEGVWIMTWNVVVP